MGKTDSIFGEQSYSYLKRDHVDRCESVFNIPNVAVELAELNDEYIIVPPYEASNNNVFVCKTLH